MPAALKRAQISIIANMLGLHWRTIFSFTVYHRLAAATKWQVGLFVFYLFLLSLLALNLFMGRYLREQLPLMIKNFPEVTFEKGHLKAPQTPVDFTIPKSGFALHFDSALKTPPAKEDFVRHNWAAVVGPDGVYMPAAAGVQKNILPATFTFTTSQAFLAQHKEVLQGTLRAIGFMASFMLIPLMFFYFFCAGMAVGVFLRLIYGVRVALGTLAKWSLFLMGPLCVLWYLNLFIGVPLFTLAVIFVCIIYLQQIFNTLPERN